jgi:hypothetical protein
MRRTGNAVQLHRGAIGDWMGEMGARAMTKADDLLGCKSELCAGALREASRLVAVRVYGPILGHALNRASELIAEIVGILAALHLDRDQAAFTRAAELRHPLDEVRSSVPREFPRAIKFVEPAARRRRQRRQAQRRVRRPQGLPPRCRPSRGTRDWISSSWRCSSAARAIAG